MPPINNPAGRLYAILTEARECPDAMPIKEVWSRVTGVDAVDTPRLYPC